MTQSNEHPTLPRRALVVGTSCAGKTTFARRAAPILGIPHFDLDDLHWGPGWTTHPRYLERLESAAVGDTWVMSGNYRSSRKFTLPRADTVFWLDYSFPLVFWRSLVRTAQRVATGEAVFEGCVETFRTAFLHRDGIPWWVLRTYQRRRREYRALMSSSEHSHLQWVVFKRPRDAQEWLEATSEARGA